MISNEFNHGTPVLMATKYGHQELARILRMFTKPDLDDSLTMAMMMLQELVVYIYIYICIPLSGLHINHRAISNDRVGS